MGRRGGVRHKGWRSTSGWYFQVYMLVHLYGRRGGVGTRPWCWWKGGLGGLLQKRSKRAGWYFRVVHVLMQVFKRNLSTLLVPSHWGKIFWVHESGTVVPLLMSAAPAPWCPSHAGVTPLAPQLMVVDSPTPTL